MIPTHTNSLVKYDNPVVIAKGTDSRSSTKEKALPGGKPKLPPVVDDKANKAGKAPTQTEDILNSILPPR
jgi:hypothetical protein